MQVLIDEVIHNLGKSPTELTDKNVTRIKSEFPVPLEQKVLWADVRFSHRLSGVVFTDIGVFIKGDKQVIDENNAGIKDKKAKVNSVYQYIKWDYFSPGDFEYKEEAGKLKVSFAGRPILAQDSTINFFKVYDDTYAKIVKEATVSAENVFADFEAVIPENFARVNTKTGHGEMAEEALTRLDKLNGNDAEVLGRDNKKDGPDRVVNGQFIQTKYCASGKKSIDACFDKESGVFRYHLENGDLMMVEVPKDQYAEAINEFRNKILEGKVPGVTNPDDAAKYIKRGSLTYKQALNLCKPGTIESLTYDALTGAVNCSFAFGLTFLSTFIISYTQTHDRKQAMMAAVAAGVQVFGLSFFAHMLTQQVARTTLTRQLIPLSTYIADVMGYKAVQSIVNAIRGMMGKGAISGAAAMKQFSKILRSNAVTAAITFVVFSAPDTYNVFQKRVSTAQYTKNMLSLIGTMAAAGGGQLAASLATAKIGAAMGTTVTPGVGTAIGLVGGLAGGLIGGAVVKAAGDAIREDDTVILSRLFNGVLVNMTYEYMLSESEVNDVIEKIDQVKQKEFRNLFKNTNAAKNQEKVMDEFLRHYFEEIIQTRQKMPEPDVQDLIGFMDTLQKNAACDS